MAMVRENFTSSVFKDWHNKIISNIFDYETTAFELSKICSGKKYFDCRIKKLKKRKLFFAKDLKGEMVRSKNRFTMTIYDENRKMLAKDFEGSGK